MASFIAQYKFSILQLLCVLLKSITSHLYPLSTSYVHTFNKKQHFGKHSMFKSVALQVSVRASSGLSLPLAMKKRAEYDRYSRDYSIIIIIVVVLNII